MRNFGNALVTNAFWSNALARMLKFTASTPTSHYYTNARSTGKSEIDVHCREATSVGEKQQELRRARKLSMAWPAWKTLHPIHTTSEAGFLGFQLVDNILRIFLRDSHVFGMTSPRNNFIVLVDEFD
jgi:hypothetical protein